MKDLSTLTLAQLATLAYHAKRRETRRLLEPEQFYKSQAEDLAILAAYEQAKAQPRIDMVKHMEKLVLAKAKRKINKKAKYLAHRRQVQAEHFGK